MNAAGNALRAFPVSAVLMASKTESVGGAFPVCRWDGSHQPWGVRSTEPHAKVEPYTPAGLTRQFYT
jgi:hypothetical protein